MAKTIETQDMAKIIIAGRIASAMPDLEDEIEAMAKTTKQKAFQAIRKGSLTPDEALTLWHEMHSYDRLLQRMRSKVTIGTSIAQDSAQSLNPTGE